MHARGRFRARARVRVRVRASVRIKRDTFPQADPQCINTQHTGVKWVLNN